MYKKYFKRLLDIFFSSFFIIALIPLFLLIASCIKIESKGPLLFKQERIGYKGKGFEIFKFRTMRVDAVQQQKIGVEVFENDERITNIGRLLRRFKLDELAQLINIFVGEMSFIGPRPKITEETINFQPKE